MSAAQVAQKSMIAAAYAWQQFEAAMAVFQAECTRGDFTKADLERGRMHAALDEYIDQHTLASMAAHEGRR